MLFRLDKSLVFWFALFFVLCPPCRLKADPAPPKVRASEQHRAAAAGRKKNAAARRKRRFSAKKKRRRCSTYASPRYRRMVRNWRKVPKVSAPKYRYGYRDLVLYSVNKGERIRIFPFLEGGALDEEASAAVKHLLRDKHTDEEHVIHPRLIKLLYRIADHYNARQITVISGYRASLTSKGESKHKQGMAVDFMIPGVPLAALAKKIRSFGHVGVGFYPVSGFVHMDVRDGPSYFWIDRSGPGKPSCIRRVFAKLGAKSDRKWKPVHDEPVVRKNKKGKPRHNVSPSKSPRAPVSAAAASKTAPGADAS